MLDAASVVGLDQKETFNEQRTWRDARLPTIDFPEIFETCETALKR